MDSIIPLGQKNTLAEYIILSSADNRPLMLDKDLYDSWKSIMELYMQNREHERMILESVEHDRMTDARINSERVQQLKQELIDFAGPREFVTDVNAVEDWHTLTLHANLKNESLQNEVRVCVVTLADPLALVETADGPQRTSTLRVSYYNPQLHTTSFRTISLLIWNKSSPSIYSSIIHPTQFIFSLVPPKTLISLKMDAIKASSVPQITYQSPQPPTQPMAKLPLVDSGLVVLVFSPGDYLIACLNKTMAFLIVVASSRFPLTNNQLRTSSNLRNQATIEDGRVTVQQVQGRQGESYFGTGYKSNVTSSGGNNASGHERTKDLDTYDSDCDDVSNAKAVLMANISNYGSDVISEIHSDSNIILYSQYLQETQQAAVQETNLYAQQDSMILSVIEQMSKQMINHVNNWEKANKEQNNESITAELERYKERVKTFEQLLNIDLSSREKMIDSQMDDMIKEKLALKQQINSLEQNLSNQIKEK
ncbi:hypothetical protein Tco_0743303 [Tanacetum coccineum]